MTKGNDLTLVERRFLNAIKHHIQGWNRKIHEDFSNEGFQSELRSLRSDPVYSKFGLDIPEYVLVRLIGRMSISIGRRLGEIYDKLPRFVAAARFGLSPGQVAEKFDGLELDLGLRYSLLKQDDTSHVKLVLQKYSIPASESGGVGVEIRYNFNPNDSARLRKDVTLAGHLRDNSLTPVYLIYSSIRPRDEAISRLTRGGWFFIQGSTASNFTTELLGTDFLALLDREEVREELHAEVLSMMRSIFNSVAFSNMTRETKWNISEHTQ